MTVAVAYKDGDRVWVGADSQASYSFSKITLSNKNNCKIIIPSKEKETIIALAGDAKMINILGIQERFIDELTYIKNEFDYKYMVTNIVPTIFTLFRKNGLLFKSEKVDNKEWFDGELIFAHKDKLFQIESNGMVIEIEDYTSIGSGMLHSIGHLNNSNYKKKNEAVINSIKSAITSATGVGYPIVISNTLVDTKIDIIIE